MSVPYERYNDDIHVEDHERSGSDSDPEDGGPHELRLRRAHMLFGNRWPRQNGLMQLSVGFMLTFMGLSEVIIIPLALDKGAVPLTHVVKIDKTSCYGIGIWTGMLLTLTGSLALRASVYRSICTVYTFFSLILVDVMIFTAAVLFLLIGYSKHWTTRETMPNDYIFGVHIVVCLLTSFGLVLIIHSFTQYYEDVFCGELQLAKRFVHCCCPCWCPPPVNQHELLQDPTIREQPPSIPV